MINQDNIILLADIGNTSIKLGLSQNDEIVHSFVLPSRAHYSLDSLGLLLRQILSVVKIKQITHSFICSVVPELSSIYIKACEKFLGIRVFNFPTDFKISINNLYNNPHEVGADRLMAAYAARQLYPNFPGIISVDFGTATTFDCIADNDYLGGLICPGLLTSQNALAKETAKLPQINLEVKQNEIIIGKDTVTSINHGFIFGFVAMTDGLCEKLKLQLPKPVKIIATGGFAKEISKLGSCIEDVLPNLILEGLKLAGKNILK